MKKIVFGIVLSLLASAVFAANSHQTGKYALGVDTSDSEFITGKYMLSNTLALTGGVLLGINGGDADGTDLGFRIGARNYLGNNDLMPFIGGRMGYATTDDGDTDTFELAAEFGAEYFLSKQFSIEGTVAIGYTSVDTNDTDSTRLGTNRAAVGFNFYF